MIDKNLLVQLIIFLISASVVWYFFFWVYRDHTVEHFRQRMFTLRDQLFDDASDGKISFNHPAYQLTRLTMNGFIRFGHRMSLFEMFVSYMLVDLNTNKASSAAKVREAINSLNNEAAEMMRQYQRKMIELVIIQSVAASPFFLVFVLSYFAPFSFFAWLRKTTLQGLSTWLSKPIEAMEEAALAYEKG